MNSSTNSISQTTTDASTDSREYYERVREELLKRSLSNSENFDRAVLSLATAIISFTALFIKDIKSSTSAAPLCALQTGIWLLAFAIIATIASVFASQLALTQQIDRAERVYLEGDHLDRELPLSARITTYLNVVSGVFFALGLISFAIFVTIALS